MPDPIVLRFVNRFNWRNVAGWTEEVFYESPNALDSPIIPPYIQLRAAARAGFLSKDCTIDDCLVNDVKAPAFTRTILLNVKGVTGPGGPTADHDSETPLAAVRAKVSSAGGPPRVYHFRGLADDDVKNGVVTWGRTGEAAFNTYMASLANGVGECTQSFAAGASKAVITNEASEPELFNVSGIPTDLAIKDIVRIKTRVAGNGPRIYYTGRVTRIDPAGVSTTPRIKVAGWSHGSCVGGEIARLTPGYYLQNSWSVYTPNYVVYKKTGKAFSPFRGRASPRV